MAAKHLTKSEILVSIAESTELSRKQVASVARVHQSGSKMPGGSLFSIGVAF